MKNIFILSPAPHLLLRTKFRLLIPNVNTTLSCTKLIAFRGSITWNQLPNYYKEAQSAQHFTQRIKLWDGSGCNCRICSII